MNKNIQFMFNCINNYLPHGTPQIKHLVPPVDDIPRFSRQKPNDSNGGNDSERDGVRLGAGEHRGMGDLWHRSFLPRKTPRGRFSQHHATGCDRTAGEVAHRWTPLTTQILIKKNFTASHGFSRVSLLVVCRLRL
ncbi:hypothetical protein NPIL_194111 [Nephila pilipes]|uniref:Uncharacterized protein n=1 Tax=Nephila pilipes TaxID=299642 RepID=A0A8X6T356_NEPPI|nr:hypothetical protein NPIL_194111 [Nephila pilipes]